MVTDANGRAYARVDTSKVGDWVETDNGFTCLGDAVRRQVKSSDDDKLYIDCDDGQHFLAGQWTQSVDGDFYVGLYPTDAPADRA